jgi:intein/homing endonuclease
MNRDNEDYWYNQWHLDTELHKNMCIKNVTQIPKEEQTSIYADTDSCESKTIVNIDGIKSTIEDWYNKNIVNGSAGETITGHESVKTDGKILNYVNNKICFTPVKRIIRHRVSKQKWRLKTKSGKEVIVTNDHSMIVFRNGEKIEVKPCEVLKTDKVLIIKEQC